MQNTAPAADGTQNDICYLLTCACCGQSCCLDEHSRIVPLMWCTRSFPHNWHRTPDQISEHDYYACSTCAASGSFCCGMLTPLAYVITQLFI